MKKIIVHPKFHSKNSFLRNFFVYCLLEMLSVQEFFCSQHQKFPIWDDKTEQYKYCFCYLFIFGETQKINEIINDIHTHIYRCVVRACTGEFFSFDIIYETELYISNGSDIYTLRRFDVFIYIYTHQVTFIKLSP